MRPRSCVVVVERYNGAKCPVSVGAIFCLECDESDEKMCFGRVRLMLYGLPASLAGLFKIALIEGGEARL